MEAKLHVFMEKGTCPQCLQEAIGLHLGPYYGDIFDCYNLGGGATGIWWVEAGDVAGHVTMLRRAPTAKNFPVQHVSGANVEKP